MVEYRAHIDPVSVPRSSSRRVTRRWATSLQSCSWRCEYSVSLTMLVWVSDCIRKNSMFAKQEQSERSCKGHALAIDVGNQRGLQGGGANIGNFESRRPSTELNALKSWSNKPRSVRSFGARGLSPQAGQKAVETLLVQVGQCPTFRRCRRRARRRREAIGGSFRRSVPSRPIRWPCRSHSEIAGPRGPAHNNSWLSSRLYSRVPRPQRNDQSRAAFAAVCDNPGSRCVAGRAAEPSRIRAGEGQAAGNALSG